MQVTRRSFGELVAGAIAAAVPYFASVRRGRSHIYDWTGGPGPYTDDPRYQPLGFGDHAPRVLLDGAACVTDVTRCQSGPEGWVELCGRDAKGTFILTPRHEVLTVIKRGNVQILPPLKEAGT